MYIYLCIYISMYMYVMDVANIATDWGDIIYDV